MRLPFIPIKMDEAKHNDIRKIIARKQRNGIFHKYDLHIFSWILILEERKCLFIGKSGENSFIHIYWTPDIALCPEGDWMQEETFISTSWNSTPKQKEQTSDAKLWAYQQGAVLSLKSLSKVMNTFVQHIWTQKLLSMENA